MHTFARFISRATFVAALALAFAGHSFAQQTAPATRPGIDSSKTMQFAPNTPIGDILNEMATRFGFIIVQPANPIPGFVNVQVNAPVNSDDAVRLLNSVLLPLGYGTIETYTTPTPGAPNSQHTILRVATLAEIKKSQLPVFAESDAKLIPVTDMLATYVIPVENLNAVTLRNDLTPFLSADADVTANAGANCLIITDTQAKIHRLVEIIATLDHQAPPNVVRTVRLYNSNAADTARLINATFNSATLATPMPAQTPTRGTRGGG